MENVLNVSTWQEKSILLTNFKKSKLYLQEGFSNYTQWLNSKEGKGKAYFQIPRLLRSK